jgi:hypothetical protein
MKGSPGVYKQTPLPHTPTAITTTHPLPSHKNPPHLKPETKKKYASARLVTFSQRPQPPPRRLRRAVSDMDLLDEARYTLLRVD